MDFWRKIVVAEAYQYQYEGTNISIQDVQSVELEMLIELDKICKRHHIPYQLFGGTLLGAVRHKGFIPWDDDIDVAMKRADYDRFLQCCEKELPKQYFLQTCFTDPTSIIQFAKIRKNGTRYENDLDNLPTSNTGIWIDIFPLDNVLQESIPSKWQRFQIQFLYAMSTASVENRIAKSPKRWKRMVRRVLSKVLLVVPKKKVDRALLAVYTRYDSKNTGYVSHLTMGGTRDVYERYMQKSAQYDRLTTFDFCGYSFLGPENYEDVLTRIYGDYMTPPPIEQQKPMHRVTVVEL